jgi:hypothetical protein
LISITKSPCTSHALDELALLADALERLVDLRAAAVNHHRIHADQLQQHHVVREAFLQLDVGHRVATVLDDDGLAVKPPDVRQRLGQDVGLEFWRGHDALRGAGHGGDET